jgi:hypothetical protein
MLCEKYKNALIDAAISGDELGPGVGAHVKSCAACEAELAEQRALAMAIDSNVSRRMNAPVPVAVLQRIEAHAAPQTTLTPVRSLRLQWLSAGAGLAAITAVMLLVFPHLRSPNVKLPTNTASQMVPRIEQAAPVVTMVLQPATPQEIRRNRGQHARPVARPEPEVLVPPDERIAFDQLIANLNSRERLAAAIVRPIQKQPEERVASIATPDIETAAVIVKPMLELADE